MSVLSSVYEAPVRSFIDYQLSHSESSEIDEALEGLTREAARLEIERETIGGLRIYSNFRKQFGRLNEDQRAMFEDLE